MRIPWRFRCQGLFLSVKVGKFEGRLGKWRRFGLRRGEWHCRFIQMMFERKRGRLLPDGLREGNTPRLSGKVRLLVLHDRRRIVRCIAGSRKLFLGLWRRGWRNSSLRNRNRRRLKLLGEFYNNRDQF